MPESSFLKGSWLGALSSQLSVLWPNPQACVYHVGMARPLRFVLVLCLLLPFVLLWGCNSRPKASSVVIRVLRDLRSPYGSEFDRRILDFQGSNPKLPSGQRLIVQTETGDYKDMLQKQTSSSEGVDLIVLDSPDDAQSSSAIQMALPQAVNVCAGLKACPANVPAIVPSQVGGVHREGAKQFVDFLQKTPAS